MLRLVALLSFVLASCSSIETRQLEEPERSLVKADLNGIAFRHIWLEFLLRGHPDEAQESLVEYLELDIRTLDAFLALDDLAEKEKWLYSNLLMFLVVMQERFQIEEWQENPDTYSILLAAKKKYPVEYETARCGNTTFPYEKIWPGCPNPRSNVKEVRNE